MTNMVSAPLLSPCVLNVMPVVALLSVLHRSLAFVKVRFFFPPPDYHFTGGWKSFRATSGLDLKLFGSVVNKEEDAAVRQRRRLASFSDERRLWVLLSGPNAVPEHSCAPPTCSLH